MVQGPRCATRITRQMKLSPIFLIVYLVVFVDSYSHHIRHYRDRFKRQQGAHLYLPGSYVLDGGERPDDPDAGPWEEWSSPNACSRSCGGGVSTQQRFCQQGYTCQGATKRHFSCNTQDCPDTGDFRSQQCSEYDPIPFHGEVYQWVPFTKTDKVCELNCMPKGERFYYRHKLQVTDGTRCNEESLDVCVNGNCQQVGCDMMLGSNMREDRCRVCGGDDSTCQSFNGKLDMQDLQVGYNDILLIPAGATNIRIRESAPSNNYLAVRNTNGIYYLNGNWRIDFPRTLEFGGTKFIYNRQPSAFTAPDTILALGPTDESIFVVLLMQDLNVGVDFEYSVPKNIVTGGTNETYAWTFDQFTSCSSSCGGGTQTRNVSCAGRRSLEPADPSLCDPNNRPVEIQRCNELPCDAQWVTKQWEKCSAPCGEGGTQTRQIYCEQILTNNIASIVDDEQCATIPKPKLDQACNQGKVCADWHTTPWKPCDHICGDGKETRTVTCYRKEKNKIIALDDADCSHEPKPETEKACNVRPCEGLDWVTSEWSGCDIKCGLANETRRVQCTTSKGEVFADELCKGEEKPATGRSCEGKSKECEQEWYASQWTECSAKCGNGVQTRRVFCAATNEDSMTKVSDDNCDASKKYNHIKECTAAVEECTGEWFSGPWSKCNKKCGGGEKTRRVICMRDDETIPATECEVDTIPSSSEECNKDPCDSDETIPMDVTKPVDVTGGEDVATSEAESETSKSETSKSETMTTEPDSSVTIEDEYEIVEDDECDDGEWVDGDEFQEYNKEDMSTSALPKESDSTDDESSSPLDASTVSDGEGVSTETSLAMESLMMSDSTFSDDMHSTVELETGSGDDEDKITSAATESSKASDITDEEGSGDESDATDSTDATTATGTTEEAATSESGTKEAETSESDTEGTVTESTVDTSDITSGSSQTDSESTSGSSTLDEEESTTVGSTDGSSSSESDDSTTGTVDSSTDTSASDTDSTPTETTDTDTESTSDQTSDSTTDMESSSSESTIELSSSSTDITTTEASTGSVTESANEDELFESNAGAETIPDSSETAESATAESATSESATTESATASDEETTVSGETDVTDTTESSVSTTESGSTTEFTSSTDEPSTTMSGLEESTSESSTESSTDITGTTETSESSESTSEGSTITEETSETGSTDQTSEIDIWSSTTETSITESTTEWDTSSLVDIFKPFLRKCKRKKQKSCKETQYGCCYDNLTPAQGPFDKGCPMPKTCNETMFGCCEDGVSIAMGKRFKGCPSTHCDESLFGCCPDKKTPAEGNDKEGCPPPPPACLKTKWGCCEDNATVATGPEEIGCEKEVIKEDCRNSKYGCCPDGIATAEGEDFKGCDIFNDNCNESYFGCCPDGKSSAAGQNYKDCKMECTSSPFGCCDDGITPAHGYSKEGCCLASTYGCCPDNIKSADGPSLEGCGCQYSAYGCCPDNITSARGYNNDGCGCQYTEHGCCPDSYTPAIGAEFQGCQCFTFQFGCCPDGVTIAKGPHQQGCGCRNTEFGCCSDNQTPATGPNLEGCECASSNNGCCLDGVTESQGPDFAGCEEVPPNLQANCVHNKDVGTCRNYTVKWYYDMEYGGCSRFWYGGCEGNDNRFKSKEDCNDVCVEPQGPERCLLPQVTGPCEGYYPMWYYDKTRNQCTQFIYRGCLGNNNKFETREECAQSCVRDDTVDACEQPKEAGPCRGQYLRWYFDKDASQCQQYYYGGCQANHNNFPTEMSCKQQCAEPGRKKDHCSLPRAQGNCTGKEPRWYYAANEKRCMPFYYSGCEGNANSFISQEHCESDCPNEVEKDTCQLPAETGECADYKERWYYDTKERSCRQFYWGGCGGNGNNFETDEDCKARCDRAAAQPPPEPQTQQPNPEQPRPDEYRPDEEQPPLHENFCFHPSESGPCRENPEPRWFYDRDGVCKQFMYGGCEGNRNNFQTEDECKKQCSSSIELCSLPKVVGPCSGSQERFYYDRSTDTCESFKYGGCMGNDNSFDDISSCEERCKQGQPTATQVPPYEQPRPSEDATAVCYAPMDTGNCTQSVPAYFYDARQQRCTTFIYSGCGGNANRYSSPEQCERQCGEFRGQDLCSLPGHTGPCDNYILKVYFNKENRRCQQFYYGGCEGNGNRFSSMEECENICYAREEAKPNLTSNEICRLRVDKGNCEGQNLDHKRWYFDDSRGECLAFIYSGCGGNFNSFSNYEQCYQTCYEFMTPYQGGRPNEVDSELPPETSETREPEPRPEVCDQYQEECKSCPYGVKMYMDDNMCRRCACANPCEDTNCPEGSQCAIDINPNYNPNATDSYYYIPVCRQTTKPGTCPSLQSESSQCDVQCRSDADCTADLKCCVRGCSYLCLRPTESEDIPGELVTAGYQPGYTEPPYQAGQYPAEVNAEEYQPEMEAREGEHAVLKCAVRGNPTPRISWKKESLLIDGTEPRYRVLVDGTLQIITLHKTDTGIYLCTADNKLGQPITNEIRLQINDGIPNAAHVLESPEEREVLVSLGSPAELQCYALGYPFPIVTWWKDDTLLPTKTQQLEVRNDYSLLVHSVQLSDLGIYTCQAYNGLGKAASWAVVVQTQGPVYSTNPDDEQFMRYVVLPPEQQQQRTEKPQPQYPYRPERVSPTPRQPPRQPPPYYREPQTEAPPVVVPEEPPPRTFTVPVSTDIKSSTTSFPVGGTIDLLCAVDGHPEPFVQWFKEEELLYPSDRIKITDSHRLLIEKAKESDSGYYKCEAYNAFSNAYSTTTITVTGMYIDPHCTDNEFFANCGLIVRANYCAHHYYAKFCCKSCTEAGLLSAQSSQVGNELSSDTLNNNHL